MLYRRALYRELTQNALGVMTALLAIVLTVQFVRLLGLAAVGKLASDAVFITMAFQLVQTLPVFLTITLFVAILMSFLRGWRDQEMPVWAAAGMSPLNWLRPVLTFSLPVVIVIGLLTLLVSPRALQLSKTYEAQLESRDDRGQIAAGTFRESGGGKAVFFVGNTSLLGDKASKIFIRTRDEQTHGVTVSALGFQHLAHNGDRFLTLHKGQRFETLADNTGAQLLKFDSYSVRLRTKEAARPEHTLRDMSTRDLFKQRDIPHQAELQWRLSVPLSALVLALLAVPLASYNPRSGRGWNVLIALLIYLLYVNVLSVVLSLVEQGKWSLWPGLWGIHSIALLTWLWLVTRQYGGMAALLARFRKEPA